MSNFSAVFMARTSYVWWDDDGVCFVLDQQAELDLCSASSLKQQSTSRYVVLLRHIILIPTSLCGEAATNNF